MYDNDDIDELALQEGWQQDSCLDCGHSRRLHEDELGSCRLCECVVMTMPDGLPVGGASTCLFDDPDEVETDD